jgi:hypothetical protein
VSDTSHRFQSILALAAIGSALTGALGLLGGVISFIDGGSLAAGALLAAAGIAFGLLANAMLRG